MNARGFTMLELLVGLLIASLCAVMLLMLFKQTSQIAVTSAQDAEYEAQLQTGMLVAQRFIQNAGYGTGSTSDIALGTHFNNPAIFWRHVSNLDTTPLSYVCQGIAEEIQADGGFKLHRLILIEKANCGTTTELTEGTWTESKAIIAIKNNSATPIYEFAMSDSDCTPFGIDSIKSGSKQLTLSAARPHITGVGSSLQTAVCLNNIKVT
jgi:prepilin-type N-terminal cleavage/methylation domain-containing protein